MKAVTQTGFVSWPVEEGWMRGAGRAGHRRPRMECMEWKTDCSQERMEQRSEGDCRRFKELLMEM